MSNRRPRFPKEEFTRRGEAIFEQKVQPHLEGEDPYKFVAIDIESGDFEVDSDSAAATSRLIAKNADAQIWTRRVGFPVKDWIGSGPSSEKPRWRKIS